MCVFCEIIKGNIPSKKIWEDEDAIAILDISQTTKGHSLVIPKKHYENVLQMPAEEFADLMKKVRKSAIDITTNLNAKGCNILINTNEAAGQSVPHAHVHIIPRYAESDSISIQFKENDFDLDDILKQIKAE